jgi:peptide/nickel transport system permease protein
MLKFIAHRCLHGIVVLLGVSLVAFSLFRFVGDPVAMLASNRDTPADRAALRSSLGLDEPIIVQFARYLRNTAHGDFGISYTYRSPVLPLIGERVPATAEMVTLSGLLALMFAIPAGVYAAVRPTGLVSRGLAVVSLAGISIPAFVLGISLITVFSVNWHLLPSFGRGQVVTLGWWTTGLLTPSGLESLIMPAVTLGLFQVALVMRLVATVMRDILQTDYVRFARARGLSPLRIYLRHALKNAISPVIAVTGIQVGSLMAFGVVTETVFQWPGVGLLLVQAVQNADIPLMATYLMLAGLFFVIVNLIVDVLCLWVDPRLRLTTAGR